GDLRLESAVHGLLSLQLLLRFGQPRRLQEIDEHEQRYQDRRAGDQAGHHPAGSLAGKRLGGKEVDLRHPRAPGIASPMATASKGSASVIASGERSRA